MSAKLGTLPTVEYVRTLPDKDDRISITPGWVGYVCGVLSSRPGRWAKVTGPTTTKGKINTASVKKSVKALGLDVEAVTRQGELYMKYNGNGSKPDPVDEVIQGAPCPDCGFIATNNTGLSAHGRNKHGWKKGFLRS